MGLGAFADQPGLGGIGRCADMAVVRLCAWCVVPKWSPAPGSSRPGDQLVRRCCTDARGSPQPAQTGSMSPVLAWPIGVGRGSQPARSVISLRRSVGPAVRPWTPWDFGCLSLFRVTDIDEWSGAPGQLARVRRVVGGTRIYVEFPNASLAWVGTPEPVAFQDGQIVLLFPDRVEPAPPEMWREDPMVSVVRIKIVKPR